MLGLLEIDLGLQPLWLHFYLGYHERVHNDRHLEGFELLIIDEV